MSADGIQAADDLWAPWASDNVTLHLVPDADDTHGDDGFMTFGACAFVAPGRRELVGPTINRMAALPLADWVHGSPCRKCVIIALRRVQQQTEERLRQYLAYEVRADLVCCDAYDVCRPSHLDDNVPLHDHPAYHDLCYWGEAVAREIEEPGHEDCDHRGGSWFDRTVCPSPCDTMHDRCVDCGSSLGTCQNRYTSYYESVPQWVEQTYQARGSAHDGFLARQTASPSPAVLAEIKRRLADGTIPRRTITLRDPSELSEDD